MKAAMELKVPKDRRQNWLNERDMVERLQKHF